jgi:polysaccharide biosynthesis protein PslH
MNLCTDAGSHTAISYIEVHTTPEQYHHMKILIISPFNIFPCYSGTNVRIYNIIKNLSRNNQVFFLYHTYQQVKCKATKYPSLKNVKLFPAGPNNKSMQLFNPFLLFKAMNIIKKEKIEIIIGEYLWSGIYLMLLKLFLNKQYFFDEHNIEYKLIQFNHGKSGKICSHFVKQYEKMAINNSEISFCISKDDKNGFTDLGIDENKMAIIPNGVESSLYHAKNKKNARKKLGILSREKIVLFFGKLDYKPNEKAVDIIRRKIMPSIIKKDTTVKFFIIGQGHFIYSHPNLLFIGAVPNLAEYIQASDVVIIPLLNGSGTRIKILEAIACGKRVISTSIGAQGLINQFTSRNLVIKDDWEGFCREIMRTFNLKDSTPPKEFYEHYAWDQIVKRIEHIINRDSIKP